MELVLLGILVSFWALGLLRRRANKACVGGLAAPSGPSEALRPDGVASGAKVDSIASVRADSAHEANAADATETVI